MDTMTLESFDEATGYARILYQGTIYVVNMPDFESMDAVKVFVMQTAEDMAPMPTPTFVPKEGSSF